MEQKIRVLTFDEKYCEDYEDVCDELVLEDSGMNEVLKRGVSMKIIEPKKD